MYICTLQIHTWHHPHAQKQSKEAQKVIAVQFMDETHDEGSVGDDHCDEKSDMIEMIGDCIMTSSDLIQRIKGSDGASSSCDQAILAVIKDLHSKIKLKVFSRKKRKTNLDVTE